MKFWLEFFKDKRFSWDFKIANFIMNDYLRSYLAVDCIMLREIYKNEDCSGYTKKRIEKILKDLTTLMEGKDVAK